MEITRTSLGFGVVEHPSHPAHKMLRIVQESFMGKSCDEPGSSYLWIGEHHRLDRDEVSELNAILTRWLATGRLAKTEAAEAGGEK